MRQILAVLATRGRATTGRRSAAVTLSLLAHVTALWAILPRAAEPRIEAGIMSASLVDGSDLASRSSAAPPAAVPDPAETKPEDLKVRPDIEPLPVADVPTLLDATAEPVEFDDAVSVQVAAAAAAAAISSDGDPCALGAWLQTALQNNPSVQAALSEVPRSARSVANAVMLWNGHWAEPTASAAKGMAQIRALVVAGISAAPASCQTQQIKGPVLMTIGNEADVTILAVGSGQWRWQDLTVAPNQMQ